MSQTLHQGLGEKGEEDIVQDLVVLKVQRRVQTGEQVRGCWRIRVVRGGTEREVLWPQHSEQHGAWGNGRG